MQRNLQYFISYFRAMPKITQVHSNISVIVVSLADWSEKLVE